MIGLIISLTAGLAVAQDSFEDGSISEDELNTLKNNLNESLSEDLPEGLKGCEEFQEELEDRREEIREAETVVELNEIPREYGEVMKECREERTGGTGSEDSSGLNDTELLPEPGEEVTEDRVEMIEERIESLKEKIRTQQMMIEELRDGDVHKGVPQPTDRNETKDEAELEVPEGGLNETEDEDEKDETEKESEEAGPEDLPEQARGPPEGNQSEGGRGPSENSQGFIASVIPFL